jgi:putative phosphoribosyl transferase
MCRALHQSSNKINRRRHAGVAPHERERMSPPLHQFAAPLRRNFRDHAHAAELLAAALQVFARAPNVIVFALAPTGETIGRVIARALAAPFGVLASCAESVDCDSRAHALHDLDAYRLVGAPIAWYVGIAARDARRRPTEDWVELERSAQTHRVLRELPDLSGQTVIVVDDGIATGSSVIAAASALREARAARIVASTPVASRFGAARVKRHVDECVAVLTPERFDNIASFYESDRPPSRDYTAQCTTVLASLPRRG